MSYSETYTASDLSKIVIDIIAGVFAAVVGFAAIFGLIIAYKFLKTGKVKM